MDLQANEYMWVLCMNGMERNHGELREIGEGHRIFFFKSTW